MLFNKLTTAFTALVAAAAAVSASPTVVVRPPITAPKAGDVWTVGTTQTITWNTTEIPASAGNPIGGVLLGYLEDGQQHLDTESPLAEGFLLTAGSVEVTVPQVAARDDYIVVCEWNGLRLCSAILATSPRSLLSPNEGYSKVLVLCWHWDRAESTAQACESARMNPVLISAPNPGALVDTKSLALGPDTLDLSDGSDAQQSLTLAQSVIATGFANDGQDQPAAGQIQSLTSTNNFINFCATSPNLQITNGRQILTGSCNPAPMGIIASSSNIPSSKFIFPKLNSTITAGTNFTIQLAISHLETGHATNIRSTYLAAPQLTDSAGDVQGHVQVVIEIIRSLEQTVPTDPDRFVFFKSLDALAVNGILSVVVAGGLPPGFYRLASTIVAANHQPVLVAVEAHGALGDMVYALHRDRGEARAGPHVEMPPCETMPVDHVQYTSWRAPASSPGRNHSDHVNPSHSWCSKQHSKIPVLPLLLTLLAVSTGVQAQFLEITAPSTLVQCTPTIVSWTGGTAPYFLSIVNIPGSTPLGLPNFSLEFNNLNVTYFTWNTGFAAGTPVVFRINDHDGTSSNHTNTAVIMTGPGANDNCLPQVGVDSTAAYYAAPGTTSSNPSMPTVGNTPWYSVTPQSSDSPGRGGLSMAGIAGVVLGSVLAGIALAVLGFRLIARAKDSSANARGRQTPDRSDAVSLRSEDSETRSWATARLAPWVVPLRCSMLAGMLRRSKADVTAHSVPDETSRPSSLAAQATVPQPSEFDFAVHTDEKHGDPGARTENLEIAPNAILRGSRSDQRGRTLSGSVGQRQARARAMDGGVRLAGGRGMQTFEDSSDGRPSSSGSTLLPPYDSSY
ncbi:hypothetical protein VTO73DRAFT_12437 [Trametes versicolor]